MLQGPYLGVFQARSQDGTLLFCVDINFRIGAAEADALAAVLPGVSTAAVSADSVVRGAGNTPPNGLYPMTWAVGVRIRCGKHAAQSTPLAIRNFAANVLCAGYFSGGWLRC